MSDRKIIMEPSVKKLKLEASSQSRTSDASVKTNQPIVRASLLRENSAKLQAVLKPAAPMIVPVPVPVESIIEIHRPPFIPDQELWKWAIPKQTKLAQKKSTSEPFSDDTIIRRKLMFEAGNPPFSSHRGVKLLTSNIGSFLSSSRQNRHQRFQGETKLIGQKVQLYLQQEELTLSRLEVAGESIAKMASKEEHLPTEVAAAIEDVKIQIMDQQKKLENANKTDARFKEYLDMATSIRKFPSFDELVKQRDILREQCRRLEKEKLELDRLKTTKQPYLLIVNWALKGMKYHGDTALPTSTTTLHHSKSSVKHKKSPKKSSKETRS